MGLPGRIVVATDFSEGAEQAARVALAWAKRLGAELHWAHALESLPKALTPSAEALLASYVEQAQHRAHDELSACVERAREAGVASESHVEDAPPARGMVELATKLDADCVVVGSRGHGVLERLLLGSVAERIAREAPCRVLVVRDEAAQGPGIIVLGDDLWEVSRAARGDALALAGAFSARLDVVHAVEEALPSLREMQSPPPDPVLEKLRAEADAKLDALLRDAPPGLEATRAVVLDDPAHAICARAEQLGAGLVVVGTRSPNDIERVLLGSVAGKVLRHAPCSVLVVR